MAAGLKRLGIAVQETPDGIIIQGGKLSGGTWTATVITVLPWRLP